MSKAQYTLSKLEQKICENAGFGMISVFFVLE